MRIKTLRIKLHKAKLPPWLYQLILSLFSVRVKGGVEEYLTTALHDKLGALSAEVVAHATLVVAHTTLTRPRPGKRAATRGSTLATRGCTLATRAALLPTSSHQLAPAHTS